MSACCGVCSCVCVGVVAVRMAVICEMHALPMFTMYSDVKLSNKAFYPYAIQSTPHCLHTTCMHTVYDCLIALFCEASSTNEIVVCCYVCDCGVLWCGCALKRPRRRIRADRRSSKCCDSFNGVRTRHMHLIHISYTTYSASFSSTMDADV